MTIRKPPFISATEDYIALPDAPFASSIEGEPKILKMTNNYADLSYYVVSTARTLPGYVPGVLYRACYCSVCQVDVGRTLL